MGVKKKTNLKRIFNIANKPPVDTFNIFGNSNRKFQDDRINFYHSDDQLYVSYNIDCKIVCDTVNDYELSQYIKNVLKHSTRNY